MYRSVQSHDMDFGEGYRLMFSLYGDKLLEGETHEKNTINDRSNLDTQQPVLSARRPRPLLTVGVCGLILISKVRPFRLAWLILLMMDRAWGASGFL